MTGLFSLHDRVFEGVERLTRGWLLTSLARLTFAAVLLVYFWNSAGTKLDGFGLSTGAFVQIFPHQAEAYGYDMSKFGLLATLIVWAGTLAEFVLPALIVLGLFTRLAALGMIGFIIVQSLTDIYGHMADSATIGAFFDGVENARILDLRTFWVFVLLYLVIKGGGMLSLDRLIGRR
ncbi:MAG: DoxX family protein [Paracoccaceae bacterium]